MSIEGNFADYLQEGKRAHPIRVTDDIVVPVPTRKQFVEYYEAQTNPDLTGKERGDASWKALLGRQYTKVMKHFDDRPFDEWEDFREFVDEVWFGRGANEVEGK